MLMVQIAFLLADLIINTFCEIFRFESVILLVVFVIQDVCLVFSLIIVFLSFISTYIFQAGLVGILVTQFRTAILVSLAYTGLSITFHVASLNKRWDEPMSPQWWNPGLLVLYVVQRFMAAIYYYYYKRTALRIADPRFYDDLAWFKEYAS